MKRLKVKWIGLKVNPLVLLKPSPLADLNKENENKEGKEVDRTKRYYEKGDITSYTISNIKKR